MRYKVLFVANIHKHFKAFHIPYIKYLKELGYEVHVAANDGYTVIEEADKQFNIPICRNPFSIDNIRAVQELSQLLRRENYCLLHCHTAMGSVTARIAAKNFRAKGLKVLYTAHGFHFYKGSPKKFWFLYYPMEKFLSRYTDGIITINKEDFNLLNNRSFENKHSFLISGIGVEKKNFYQLRTEEKMKLREEFGLSRKDFILVYAAEYINRKNHHFLVQSIKSLKRKVPNLKVLLAGRGKLYEEIGILIQELEIEKTVFQLGFRSDIDKIYKIADVGVSTSKQEGLGLNLIEEMMCGLPVVATIDRGHKELINHGLNGYLFPQNNQKEFVNYVYDLYINNQLYQSLSSNAIKKAEKFTLKNSLEQMGNIYKEYLPCKEEI